MKISKLLQSHVTFTTSEYETIREDALLHKKSIPSMLKAVYFRHEIGRPLMPPVEAQSVFNELNRIGNNLNQIARNLNSGFRKDFNPAVDEMRDYIQEIRNILAGKHGHRQN